MDESQFFDNIEKDSAINNLLNLYLEARKKISFPTNKNGFDEDVNIYISHLLFAIAMPNYNYITEQYISLDPEEVKVLIDMAEDNYLKYFIYKVNGDNLLLQIGLDNDFPCLANLKSKNKKVYSLEDYIGYARSYYENAAACNRKIHRKKTALSEVLMKVVKNFNGYTDALKLIRTDYYRFYSFYEDKNFSQFTEEISEYEREVVFEEKRDYFLELYSMWLEDKSLDLREKINDLCAELHKLKPSFLFKIED